MLVIARQGAVFLDTYGFLPDFELENSRADSAEPVKDQQTSNGSIDLANGGDEVLLLDIAKNLSDSVSWGSSIWAFSPSVHGAGEGASIERYLPWVDTDRAVDWRIQYYPDPGNIDATLPTFTPSPSLTITPTPPVILTATATSTPTFPPGGTHTVTGTAPAPTKTPAETPSPTALTPGAWPAASAKCSITRC